MIHSLSKIITADARILSVRDAAHYDHDWECLRGYFYIADQHGNRYSDDCMTPLEAWQTMTDEPCNNNYIAGLDDEVQ